MEKFAQWGDKRQKYAKEWKKRTGGKVMGYMCTYVPEEILYAADILPVRILGSHEAPTAAEPYLFAGLLCPFCRDCLSQGLKGRYDYLDGMVIAQSCFAMRPVFWSWVQHIGIDYHYYIMMNHGVQTTPRYKFLTRELEEFKKSIEGWVGKTITDKDLDKGIEIMNTNRRLTRQVYEFRKKDAPPITGLETMEIAVSSQMVDKREHSEALRKLLKKLPERKLNRETGTRLMIIGSEDDDREFVKMVEEQMSLPATFVIEDHCTGSRYFWNEVIPQENRVAAIAARYLDRPPCPSKDWPLKLRWDHILKLAKEYKVEGAIVMQQKFCEPHELDTPELRKFLEKNGIPTYFLEFDVTVPVGQFKTRVEAFLETMVELV
jgi:benzoyl-CoA reductase subunit C